jgi:hypothetical protein
LLFFGVIIILLLFAKQWESSYRDQREAEWVPPSQRVGESAGSITVLRSAIFEARPAPTPVLLPPPPTNGKQSTPGFRAATVGAASASKAAAARAVDKVATQQSTPLKPMEEPEPAPSQRSKSVSDRASVFIAAPPQPAPLALRQAPQTNVAVTPTTAKPVTAKGSTFTAVAPTPKSATVNAAATPASSAKVAAIPIVTPAKTPAVAALPPPAAVVFHAIPPLAAPAPTTPLARAQPSFQAAKPAATAPTPTAARTPAPASEGHKDNECVKCSATVYAMDRCN